VKAGLRVAWFDISGFCVEALQEALARYDQPEIFNTEQGNQFTGLDFTGVLKDSGVAISTDGFEAERVIGDWIDFYNTERPHSSLDGQTPVEAHGARQPVDMLDKADALTIISTGGRPPLRAGSTARCDKQNYGGMVSNRNTP